VLQVFLNWEQPVVNVFIHLKMTYPKLWIQFVGVTKLDLHTLNYLKEDMVLCV
jgi:hypothetical protein